MKITVEYSYGNTAFSYGAGTRINGRWHFQCSDKSYDDAERLLLDSIRAYQPPPEPKEVEI